MDIVIDELIVEEDRSSHIAKHDVSVTEVAEIVENEYVFVEGKYGRWILIGLTKKRRMLAVVVGARRKKNVYGLITARVAHKKERTLYQKLKQERGGDEE